MGEPWTSNLLLAAVAVADRALILPHLKPITLCRGEVLFEPGDDVVRTHFPCRGTIVSLVTIMREGHALEAATVGYEGAIGGLVSAGHKPAFTRSAVEVGGDAWCLPTARLEEAKARSHRLHDLFSRYADILFAQTLQSVACNARHSIEQRSCRWLLSTQDRIGDGPLKVSQEYLANLLGVQRTSVSSTAQALQARKLIQYRHGVITIVDRAGLEDAACSCYGTLEHHFRRMLPDVKRAEARVQLEERPAPEA